MIRSRLQPLLIVLVMVTVFLGLIPSLTPTVTDDDNSKSLAAATAADRGKAVALETLDLSKMRQGWGKPKKNLAVTEAPMTIAGQRFAQGVGTHAPSRLWIDLGGRCERFRAKVGVDDAAGGKASVRFRVIGDGKKLFDSGTMKHRNQPQEVDVDLRGINHLLLEVTDAGDGRDSDHANWADATIRAGDLLPKAIDRPRSTEAAVILTPPAGPAPRINGPRVYGCRPGNPFLFRIPTTGVRPIRFAVENLPEGIVLDADAGILRGTAPPRGEYVVTVRASNPHGRDERKLKIVSGDQLALTPPMGWNHWYAHYNRITDKMMRQAADAMVESGMADVGYQYVSIDDCWMNAPQHADPRRVGPLRDAQGNILPNTHFPDMKALTDYIHAKGLKAGIYSSPGPLTCARFAGSYGHEEQDAKQFAAWGFDFLKYDWCSYGNIAKNDPSPPRERLQRPYRLMGEILKRQNRDIVFNLCQYGMGDVWEWGAEVGGHCWRTSGDLGFELDRIFEVALKNAEHRQWSKPGAWNDPDYIQIGYIGNARGKGQPEPCPLSPNEQYAFMSMWCLMAAPLFYSGDMSRLDPFTLNVLCNPEVIEVDQDPLGQCARVVMIGEDTFLMIKDLEDGAKAVGLFNRGETDARTAVAWSQWSGGSKHNVRDLWRQKDLGEFDRQFETVVPARGGVLIKVTPIGLNGAK